MSSEKAVNTQNSFDNSYGQYLSERNMLPIDLETLDMDASALELQSPVGAICCVCVAAFELQAE